MTTPSPVTTLPIAHLRLAFRPDRADAEMPGGEIWRSAFGLQLRRRACVTGAPSCAGCTVATACAYPQLMANRTPAGGPLLRADAEAPNPYVLAPRAGADQGHAELDLRLFGPALGRAPLLLSALEAAAAEGLGRRRERWRLEAIARVEADGRALEYPRGTIPPALHFTIPPAPPSVLVYLESPLRLRVEGRELRPEAFSFSAFFTALLRRSSLLGRCFGDPATVPDVATVRALIAAAQRIEMEPCELYWQSGRRWSSRQQQTVPTSGVIGRFALRGELAPLWPWLWRGRWLHVGKGAVMGLGVYHLEIPRAPQNWLVSRHPGAVEFLHRAGQRFDRQVAHLDVAAVQPGDTVIGTLPLNLAAQVCARGARFLFLALDLPPELRGKELDADRLAALGARLEEYRVERVQPMPGEAADGQARTAMRPGHPARHSSD